MLIFVRAMAHRFFVPAVTAALVALPLVEALAGARRP